MTEARIILTTFPDLEKARQIGTALVEKQLAACVNLNPKAESIYRWEGKVQNDAEVVAIIKSTSSKILELEAVLHERHPYDVPEFLVFEVEQGSEAYLKWLGESC